VEQRVEEAVADLLHHVGRPGIAHEGRARGAPDGGAGEAGGDEGRLRPVPADISARYIFSLIEPIRISGRFLADHGADLVVVGLATGVRATAKAQGRPRSTFEEVAHAAGIGLVRDDPEGGRGEEILRDGAPEVPDRLDRGMLLRSMNGSGSRPVSSPSLRRNFVVLSTPIGACR
jgi:hypothetical protein